MPHNKISTKFIIEGSDDTRIRYLNEVLEALDEVHGGANLTATTVKSNEIIPSDPDAPIHGQYDHETENGPLIRISADTDRPGLTFIHEIGHRLDWAIGFRSRPRKPASEKGSPQSIADWYTCVKNSEEVSKLEATLMKATENLDIYSSDARSDREKIRKIVLMYVDH